MTVVNEQGTQRETNKDDMQRRSPARIQLETFQWYGSQSMLHVNILLASDFC